MNKKERVLSVATGVTVALALVKSILDILPDEWSTSWALTLLHNTSWPIMIAMLVAATAATLVIAYLNPKRYHNIREHSDIFVQDTLSFSTLETPLADLHPMKNISSYPHVVRRWARISNPLTGATV